MCNIQPENNHLLFVIELFYLLITNHDDLKIFEHNALLYFFSPCTPWLILSITTNKNIHNATVERCTNSAHILTYLRFWWHSPGEFYQFVEYMSHVKWIRLSKECIVQVINYAKDHKIIKRCTGFPLMAFISFIIMYYISDWF